VGETKNVDVDQYIWLAIDNPEFSKCWPKIQIQRNIEFNTMVLEEELKGNLRLSIYLLNEKSHRQWQEWQSKENPRGVRMPSGNKHLDFVNLILE